MRSKIYCWFVSWLSSHIVECGSNHKQWFNDYWQSRNCASSKLSNMVIRARAILVWIGEFCQEIFGIGCVWSFKNISWENPQSKMVCITALKIGTMFLQIPKRSRNVKPVEAHLPPMALLCLGLSSESINLPLYTLYSGMHFQRIWSKNTWLHIIDDTYKVELRQNYLASANQKQACIKILQHQFYHPEALEPHTWLMIRTLVVTSCRKYRHSERLSCCWCKHVPSASGQDMFTVELHILWYRTA